MASKEDDGFLWDLGEVELSSHIALSKAKGFFFAWVQEENFSGADPLTRAIFHQQMHLGGRKKGDLEGFFACLRVQVEDAAGGSVRGVADPDQVPSRWVIHKGPERFPRDPKKMGGTGGGDGLWSPWGPRLPRAPFKQGATQIVQPRLRLAEDLRLGEWFSLFRFYLDAQGQTSFHRDPNCFRLVGVAGAEGSMERPGHVGLVRALKMNKEIMPPLT